MFTEYVSSVYYKHHIKHRTFFLNDAIFLLMFDQFLTMQCLLMLKNVKLCANDASNDGHRPPLGEHIFDFLILDIPCVRLLKRLTHLLLHCMKFHSHRILLDILAGCTSCLEVNQDYVE